MPRPGIAPALAVASLVSFPSARAGMCAPGSTGCPGTERGVGCQGGPARILVVDDDPQTLRYVRDALTASGYAPLVTGGDADLSHIIRTEKPHLVLLDLMLPGTDGIALMESVPELAELPVVFIPATDATKPSHGRWRAAPRTTS